MYTVKLQPSAKEIREHERYLQSLNYRQIYVDDMVDEFIAHYNDEPLQIRSMPETIVTGMKPGDKISKKCNVKGCVNCFYIEST